MKNQRLPHKPASNRNIQKPRSQCEFQTLVAQNVRLAKRSWPGRLTTGGLETLRKLTSDLGLCLTLGDLIYLDSGWYITHVGLLRIAHRNGCSDMQVRAVREFCEPKVGRWVFKAIVHKSPDSKGFVGYGDADPSKRLPSSVVPKCASPKPEPSIVLCARLMESASARSRNSVHSHPPFRLRAREMRFVPPNGNGSANGQPRLRDKLCLLIRKYELDPNLVKRYAADFCGTESLRDAGRDLVEAFVSTVAEEAAKDRAALVCKLNSYSQPQEVKS